MGVIVGFRRSNGVAHALSVIDGANAGATAIKRKAALIIDNMSKLVEPPTEAEIFLPVLLPELKKCSEEVSDQDCRSVFVDSACVQRFFCCWH